MRQAENVMMGEVSGVPGGWGAVPGEMFGLAGWFKMFPAPLGRHWHTLLLPGLIWSCDKFWFQFLLPRYFCMVRLEWSKRIQFLLLFPMLFLFARVNYYVAVSHSAVWYPKMATDWKVSNYKLTEEILDRELRVATTFASISVDGQPFQDDAEAMLEKFIRNQINTGMPATHFVFGTGVRKTECRSADIAQCDPGRCLEKSDRSMTIETDQADCRSFRN